MTKGNIQYYFKGIKMKKESGSVVNSTHCEVTVSRDIDGQIINFVHQEGKWLLSGNTTSTSLLFGTQFIFNQ
jgi:hypothetical protein